MRLGSLAIDVTTLNACSCCLPISNLSRATTSMSDDEVFQTPHEAHKSSRRMSIDEIQMNGMGYEQELARGLDGFKNFAFGFTEVACLVSVGIVFGAPGMIDGGPSVIIWGFITAFFCTTVISYSMAEICAAYPSAGCVYHWAAQVVPPHLAAVASYTTGWANFVGNAAGDASFANGFVAFLSAALVASGYEPIAPGGPQVGVAIGILFVQSVLNFFEIDKVGFINNLAAACQFASLFIMTIGVPACSALTSSASFVFTQYWDVSFNNLPDGLANFHFFSKSYIVCVGITTSLFTFVGYEASGHMAEETHNAALEAPKGLVNTVLATGFGALSLYLAFCFATSYPIHQYTNAYTNNVMPAFYNPGYAVSFGFDAAPTAAVTVPSLWIQPAGTYYDTSTCSMRTATGNGLINLFMQATSGPDSCNRPSFGKAMAWLLVINAFFAGLSSVAVTGRITYAMARDNGFPLAHWLKQVHPTLMTPVNSIIFVLVSDALIMLLPLNTAGGAAAFTAIIGLSTICFQISYGLPVLFKLISRPTSFPTVNPLDGTPLPYQLGWLSTPMAILSCMWLFGTSFFYFLPTSGPVFNSPRYINNNDALLFNNPQICMFQANGGSNYLNMVNGVATRVKGQAVTIDATPANGVQCVFGQICATAIPGLTYTIGSDNSTNAVFIKGVPVDDTITDTLGSMQWLFVCFLGCVIICMVNWLVNSRHTFTGPKRVASGANDTYYFLWWTYTPEWYTLNYPGLFSTTEHLNASADDSSAVELQQIKSDIDESAAF